MNTQLAKQAHIRRYLQVQVPTNPEDASSTPVVASVPARCLAGSHNNEALQLHLSPASLVTSIEYRANCDQATTDTLAKGWSPPQEVDVICKFPETVQSIRVVHSPGNRYHCTTIHAAAQSALCLLLITPRVTQQVHSLITLSTSHDNIEYRGCLS